MAADRRHRSVILRGKGIARRSRGHRYFLEGHVLIQAGVEGAPPASDGAERIRCRFGGSEEVALAIDSRGGELPFSWLGGGNHGIITLAIDHTATTAP